MSLSPFNADHSWFKQLFESSPDPTWIIDNNRFVECNEAAVRTLGYLSREEFLNAHPSKLSPPRQPDGEDSYVKAERMMAIAKDQGQHRFEWIHSKADGMTFAAEVTLSAIELRDRKVIYCVWRDITERKRAEQSLRDSERELRAIFDGVLDGILVADVDTRKFLAANAAICGMLGYTQEEIVGICVSDIHPKQDLPRVIEQFERQLRGEIQMGANTPMIRKDGSVFYADIKAAPIRLGGKDAMLGIFHDTTERKQMEEDVRHLAFYDALTNLANRRLLNDRLIQTIAANKRSGCYGAMMFLDLDNFKLLNDTQGHEVGDLLLIEATDRLKSCIREMDTLARFGGDEFVVMIVDLDVDKSEATTKAGIIADKVRAALAKPYEIKIQREGEAPTTVEHQCTASIGVALFGKDETSRESILKWADTAMYRAKEAGRNLIRFYDPKD